MEIFKKSYVIKKYVYDFETKNNTNHKPLFVVCDYITNCVCDFETRPVQSVKIKEGIGKWKHQQKISNELLQEFLQAEDSDANNSFDDDDCQETSSSAPEDEHFDDYDSFCELWTPITQIPNPDHQCHYVHRERKRPIRLHLPTCPIQSPNINLMFVIRYPRNMTFL